METLEQPLYSRRREAGEPLVRHSGHGVQYVAIRYTERVVETEATVSVGTVGDSYDDNALAEAINRLYEAVVVHRRSWLGHRILELTTLNWVGWFNHGRLIGPAGKWPSTEAEAQYYRRRVSIPEAT